MNKNLECPFCEAVITLPENTVEDELLECSECGTQLVVTALEPIAVEEAPQVEEDWGQ